MTKQDQIAAIRQKCIAANPEIATCHCTRGVITTQAFTSFKCGLCKKNKSWRNGLSPKWCNECATERRVCGHCKTSIFKVFSRPIRLADVLLAIHAGFARNAQGKMELDQDATDLVVLWNWRADDLDQQSEETISFLHSLLV